MTPASESASDHDPDHVRGRDPVALVRPLEDGWRPVLDRVLRELGAPATDDVARLAPRLAELSRAYNAGEAGVGQRPVPLEARVAFSFARDVPKGAGAVRELVATGDLALAPGGPPLRVLDLGAGLGAMTWGAVRALAAAGARGAVEARLVDADARALAAAEQIVRAAHAAPLVVPEGVALTVRTDVRDLSRAGFDVGSLGPADLVLVGQVLSELDGSAEPGERASRHAALLEALLERVVAPGGALVVVEPALRSRTRHLHAVRDLLVSGEREGGARATLFGPCLHAAACPALASEGDWCHEDLGVDLPAWLAPLARAAGLRWQGLTFSHLVLRKDGRTLTSRMPAGGLRLRVVSDRLVTKGKTEVFACTEAGERVRLRRLERDERAAPSAWDTLRRGDLVRLAGGELERGRVGADVAVDVWPARK